MSGLQSILSEKTSYTTKFQILSQSIWSEEAKTFILLASGLIPTFGWNVNRERMSLDSVLHAKYGSIVMPHCRYDFIKSIPGGSSVVFDLHAFVIVEIEYFHSKYTCLNMYDRCSTCTNN